MTLATDTSRLNSDIRRHISALERTRLSVGALICDVFYVALAIAAAPWWMRKTRSDWRGRFGAIGELTRSDRPRVMLHAVSVGEVNLVRPLVERLLQDVDVVVSTTTDTGMARAKRLYGDMAPEVQVVRYPLDLSQSVNKFLRAAAPDVVGLVELELWPNFLRASRVRGVPVAVVNGRLSERSFRGYMRGRLFVKPLFASLAFAAVQDEVYAERFRRVGATPGKCVVTGTMKWDSAQIGETAEGADKLAAALGVDRSKPLIVAGSTAPGEAALLHRCAPPGAQLLCAPRRPEWFDEAQREMPGCVRRSQVKSSQDGKPRDRFLLDSIGELRQAYALADITVIGRSFVDLYGSDPMEAAALGKPVVIGPAVDDFATTVRTLLDAEAIIQTTRESLSDTLSRLLADSQERRLMGERARACVVANQGAAERCAKLLLSLLPVKDEHGSHFQKKTASDVNTVSEHVVKRKVLPH